MLRRTIAVILFACGNVEAGLVDAPFSWRPVRRDQGQPGRRCSSCNERHRSGAVGRRLSDDGHDEGDDGGGGYATHDGSLGSIKVGQKYKGTVTRLIESGAFVEIGGGLRGLVRATRMAKNNHVRAPGDAVEEGQEVDVWIYRVPSTSGQGLSVGLSMVETRPSELKDPLKAFQGLSPQMWLKAEVRFAAQRGIYLEVDVPGPEGGGVQGFLPKQNMQDTTLMEASHGQEIAVQLERVDERTGTVSMKNGCWEGPPGVVLDHGSPKPLTTTPKPEPEPDLEPAHEAIEVQPDEHPATKGQPDIHPATKGQIADHPATKGQPDTHPATKGQTADHPATKGQIDDHPATKGQPEMHPATKGQIDDHPATKGQPEMHPATKGQTEIHAATKGQPEMHPATTAQPDEHPATKGQSEMHPATKGPPDEHPATKGELTGHPATKGQPEMHSATKPEPDGHPATKGQPDIQPTGQPEVHPASEVAPDTPLTTVQPAEQAATKGANSVDAEEIERKRQELVASWTSAFAEHDAVWKELHTEKRLGWASEAMVWWYDKKAKSAEAAASRRGPNTNRRESTGKYTSFYSTWLPRVAPGTFRKAEPWLDPPKFVDLGSGPGGLCEYLIETLGWKGYAFSLSADQGGTAMTFTSAHLEYHDCDLLKEGDRREMLKKVTVSSVDFVNAGIVVDSSQRELSSKEDMTDEEIIALSEARFVKITRNELLFSLEVLKPGGTLQFAFQPGQYALLFALLLRLRPCFSGHLRATPTMDPQRTPIYVYLFDYKGIEARESIDAMAFLDRSSAEDKSFLDWYQSTWNDQIAKLHDELKADLKYAWDIQFHHLRSQRLQAEALYPTVGADGSGPQPEGPYEGAADAEIARGGALAPSKAALISFAVGIGLSALTFWSRLGFRRRRAFPLPGGGIVEPFLDPWLSE